MAGNRVLLAEDDRVLRRACESPAAARDHRDLGRRRWGRAPARPERCAGPDPPRHADAEDDGAAGAQNLRADERTRAIPVLVLSNSSREGDVREVTKLGVEGYLVKADLSLQELGDRVVAIFDGKTRG